MNNVKMSRNYDLLVYGENNRPIRNRPDIKKLMIKYGFNPDKPIIVMRKQRNGQWVNEIIDGQHRFRYAKELGIPYYYKISDCPEMTVIEINTSQKTWTFENYLGHHCGLGNRNYAILDEYVKETGLKLSQAIAILSGKYTGQSVSGNILNAYRNGDFRVHDVLFAYRIGNVVQSIKKHIDFSTDRSFVIALAKALNVDGFDDAIFAQKVKTNFSRMCKQTDTESYLSMIDAIYNLRNKKPLPILFSATRLAA